MSSRHFYGSGSCGQDSRWLSAGEDRASTVGPGVREMPDLGMGSAAKLEATLLQRNTISIFDRMSIDVL